MINLSDLKLKEIRNSFEININGEIQEIVIFNLLNDDRQNIKNKISELNQKGLEGKELVEELYSEVFMECTNIVLDDHTIDVLNNPTSDMSKVMQEVSEIIYEIQTETMMEKYQMMCNLRSTEYAKLMLLKTQETMLITQKCKETEKNIEDLKSELKEGK